MDSADGKNINNSVASSRPVLREVNRQEILMQSPQKTQQLNCEHEILEENHKKIVVKESEKKEVLKQSSLNFINNLQPEETIWRGEEKKREGFEEHFRDSGANCSALSSDDEAFVECHSYIGDQTIDNPLVLNTTDNLNENFIERDSPVEEHLSSTFDSGTESKSPGNIDVNLIATEFVEEIVSRALAIVPGNGEESTEEVNKSPNLEESQENSLNKTVVAADSTLILDEHSEKKNTSLDDEIVKLTENLSKIKLPEQSEEEEISQRKTPINLNGTFDVSMKSVEENLNGTFESVKEIPESTFVPTSNTIDLVGEKVQENPVNTLVTNSNVIDLADDKVQENPESTFTANSNVIDLIQDIIQENPESTVIIEKNKMPETEQNLSRNESFDESPARDSPKTPSVSSSFNNLNNQPDSASHPSNTFVENLITENVDFAFKVPELPGDGATQKKLFGKVQENVLENAFTDNEFQPGNEFEFTQSDLDYLLTRGNHCGEPIDRNSVLLRFDPLLNQPIPATSHLKASISRQQQKAPIEEVTEEEEAHSETPNLEDTVAPCMSENDELGSAVNTSDNSLVATTSCEYTKDLNSESDSYKDCLSHASSDATMSVDVIKEVVSDEVKSVGNINSEDSFKKEYKMAELEKKIKNEVLKTEDIEKKLKEAEAREEALLKRITENQKTITKMTGVLEAYEKTIAELIAEKQQIIESYEKKCADLQNERDLNFTHLTSLEGTFTDLHAKYERSKQITTSLKKSEESLIAEKKQCFENLRLQEQRYEKMKSHAMQQLELANSKLDVLSKTHAQETAKLKALLKKEEISRLSTNEQLIQKTRENEELVKICDELINGSAPTS
ncbi:transforming acidic coiled-coil-containing protein 2 isoform X2 [Phlebotomus papatasi]|uniref:transforming acidic coiled-coil-containing protein 2 isoform X2 n=1 Tax=Phlebotomus papatasi TaxID=29031 RepID=UPI0024835571|nr:transforming acidic coiled-coil-containing protein 2 isoform X2 [Phlebotomus papatasi]